MGFIGILQIPMGDCLVGAHLVCGLVVCAGYFRCSCHVSDSAGCWRDFCEDDESDRDFQ